MYYYGDRVCCYEWNALIGNSGIFLSSAVTCLNSELLFKSPDLNFVYWARSRHMIGLVSENSIFNIHILSLSDILITSLTTSRSTGRTKIKRQISSWLSFRCGSHPLIRSVTDIRVYKPMNPVSSRSSFMLFLHNVPYLLTTSKKNPNSLTLMHYIHNK